VTPAAESGDRRAQHFDRSATRVWGVPRVAEMRFLRYARSMVGSLRSTTVRDTRWQLAALAIAVGVLVAPPATADTMKCGQSQVTVGDTQVTVLQLCGEPAARQVISGGEGSTSARKEQWIYDRGKRRFQARLTFEGVTLTQIEFLSRQ
jgi:hypothetical protein